MKVKGPPEDVKDAPKSRMNGGGEKKPGWDAVRCGLPALRA
jgi:hypothetical protein